MRPRGRLIGALLLVGGPNGAGLSHTGMLCKLCAVLELPLLTCYTDITVQQPLGSRSFLLAQCNRGQSLS